MLADLRDFKKESSRSWYRGINVLWERSSKCVYVSLMEIERLYDWSSGKAKVKLLSKRFEVFLQKCTNSWSKVVFFNYKDFDKAGRFRFFEAIDAKLFDYFRAFLCVNNVNSSKANLNNYVKAAIRNYKEYQFKSGIQVYESNIRDSLARKESGFVEVSCLVGRVDVVTLLEVIEVKEVNYWKSALGQVLAYLPFFPGKTPRLHLYGAITEEFKDIINTVCGLYNVKVSYEFSDKICALGKKALKVTYEPR